MSSKQLDAFAAVLKTYAIDEFHHGGARGADTEADAAVKLIAPLAAVHVLRPKGRGDELARNRVIVSRVDVLIAAPLQDEEITRSGTWATIRYARAAGKPVIQLPR